jgi:hypothetical protein
MNKSFAASLILGLLAVAFLAWWGESRPHTVPAPRPGQGQLLVRQAPPDPRPQARAATAPVTRSPDIRLDDVLRSAPTHRDYDARARFLASLYGRPLSDADVARLLADLAQPASGMEYKREMALKNDIINVLTGLPQYRGEVTAALLGIYRDPAQGDLMRDYAIQHLSEWRQRALAGGHQADVAAIEAATWDGLREKAETISGTALLALTRWAADESMPAEARDQFAARHGARLRSEAARIATDPASTLSNRITAVSIQGRLGDTSASPNLLRLAGDQSSPVMLRTAAIGALGSLGQPLDDSAFELLANLAAGADHRLAVAASAALNRLTSPNRS